MAIRNIRSIEIQNCIVDEIHIRERTNNVNLTPIKDNWEIDTYLLARFLGDLEAGNINNEGLEITQFAIKRRKIDELNNIVLGYIPFDSNNTVEFIDYTQPVGDFVYSIVPVGINGLEGKPNEIVVSSEFVGWWIVDKDTNETFKFDTQLDGDSRQVGSQLNQGRVLLETLYKYPTIFYTEKQYESFTLSAIILPRDYTFNEYKRLVDMITQHKPLLVKGGAGDFYICDIHSPQKQTLLNAYKTYDYIDLTVECTEIMKYEDYMNL